MRQALFIPLGFGLLLLLPYGAGARALLNAPFTSQAPFGSWGSPWQDFCEEASVVMAAHFVWRAALTPELADFQMQIIRQFEAAVFGRWKDTSAEETARILRELYGFSNVATKQIESPDDIKKELSAGRLVLAPAAGRQLGNPYFTPPGPRYHMLVIRGFDDDRGVFMTNDPGTRRGEGLRYPQQTLFAAIHDLNNGDVADGEKRVIIIAR